MSGDENRHCPVRCSMSDYGCANRPTEFLSAQSSPRLQPLVSYLINALLGISNEGLVILLYESTSCRGHARNAATMTVSRGVQGRSGS